MTLPGSEEGRSVGFRDRRPGLVAGVTACRIWQPGACAPTWVGAKARVPAPEGTVALPRTPPSEACGWERPRA